MKKLSVLFALLAVAMMAKADDFQITADAIEVEAGATSATLNIKSNADLGVYAAFQIDITFPEGITWKKNSAGKFAPGNVKIRDSYYDEENEETVQLHTVSYSEPSENTLRIVCYSESNAKFKHKDTFISFGLVLDENLEPGVYDVKLSNMVFASSGDESGVSDSGDKPADYTATITINGATQTEITLKITDAQYSTLILPFDADLPEGLKASTVEWPETGNELVETEVTDGKLLAGVPYLMFGEEVKTYTFTGVPTYAEETGTAGAMVGVLAESTVPAGCYVLQKQDGKVAFYKVTKERAFHANRCYLIAKPNGANMYRIGGTTGIDEVTVEEAGDVYDMLGRKVIGPLEKGVYIKNNRKIYVK